MQQHVSREVVDGGSVHVWLDLTSKKRSKEVDGFIEITASVLEILTDELFVAVLRPPGRLNAPEEAPRRLPGMKAVCLDRLGARRIQIQTWEITSHINNTGLCVNPLYAMAAIKAFPCLFFADLCG